MCREPTVDLYTNATLVTVWKGLCWELDRYTVLYLGLFLSSYHAQLCHITDVRFGPVYGATFSLNKIGYGIGMVTGKIIKDQLTQTQVDLVFICPNKSQFY